MFQKIKIWEKNDNGGSAYLLELNTSSTTTKYKNAKQYQNLVSKNRLLEVLLIF